jgi:Oxaloacetate decarboxylase, gamma chain.
MSENVTNALIIMGKGMLSIFVVIIVLTLIVVLLSKITNLPFFKKVDNDEE